MDLTVTGQLTVDGATTLRSSLTTTNFTRFQSVATQGALAVSGPASLEGVVLTAFSCDVDGALNVAGKLETRALQVSAGLQIDGPLEVAAQGDVANALDVTGALEVDGAALLQGALVVSGNAALTGGASTGAPVTVGQTLSVAEGTLASKLDATSGNVNSLTGSSGATIGSDLLVLDSLDIDDTYSCGGDLAVSGGLLAALKDGVVDSYSSIGGLLICTDLGVSGHLGIRQPTVPPTVGSSTFYGFGGDLTDSSAAVAPNSSDLAGEIVISPGTAVNFGTTSSEKTTTIDVQFGYRSRPTFQESIILLQHVDGFTYPAERFWSVEDLTVQGEVSGFRLSVRTNLFQGFPGGQPLSLYWICTQFARFSPS